MFFRLAFPRLGVALLAAFLFLPALASAQQEVQGRFRVMIPDLFPGEDTGRGFGEDVAEELRDLINQLPTHEPSSATKSATPCVSSTSTATT